MSDNVKPSDILARAQELLGDKGQRWIQGAYHEVRAKRVLGIPCPILGKAQTTPHPYQRGQHYDTHGRTP